MDKAKEKLLYETYNRFVQTGMNIVPPSEIDTFVDADIMGYGTTLDEKILSASGFLELVERQKEQANNIEMKFDISPVLRRVLADENTAVFVDEITVSMLINNETYKMFLRFSSVLEYQENKWLVVHWHGSKPGYEEGGADTWHIDEHKAKIEKLEKEVAEKTADLLMKNRELEIEACLERVRTSAMAMKESSDMVEVCRIISDQLQLLGVHDIRNVQTAIINESKGTYLNYQYFTAYKKGTIEETEYKKHLKVHEMVREMQEAANVFFSGSMKGKELEIFREYRKQDKQFPDPQLDESAALYYHFYSIGQGGLGLTTYKEIDRESLDIFKRFHNVFQLAYRRFIDIENAISQAKEAQIEASLERVRSRSIRMHHTSELQEVVNLVARELHKMEMDITGVFIAINNQDVGKEFTFWGSSGVVETYVQKAAIPFLDHPTYMALTEAVKTGGKFLVEEFTREEKIAFFKHLFKYPPYNSSTPEWKKQVLSREGGYTRSVCVSRYTTIFVVNHHGRKLSDADNEILKRFGKVFEQSYIRFLDLQKAEAQAREAVKQAALDRIRGEIASMRTAEDLNRITPVIWHELKALEVPFIRCGVFIVDEANEKVQVYLTTPDGKALAVLNLSFDANDLTRNTVDYWRKKKVYKEHWDKLGFINWTKSMMELGQVQNAETYQGSSAPPESLDLHFVPFGQGMLYVGDVSPLTDEKLDLVKTLAEAFSIAYARFEDFKNLEEAKNKVEVTLEELRSTQAQLIHSEKMASLGELTAGIAHEIKNPLNFVNNFSELSRELLEEMVREMQNGNEKEAMELYEDVKLNLERINHHGKRADSIVKGMLLHSRGTSGEKALTDINDLLDQYVNLAYHGMRAQNKEFNITIEKNYDKSLEKINVVPQDISRVFLNIINNACYAAYDKKKKGSDNNISPILRVSTKNLDEKVEIKIGDNGNGIPADILDKIFQPFFTTKPTGEGTGLGLSLSYDIVTKQHGGELKVETKDGEGAEFIITLPNG